MLESGTRAGSALGDLPHALLLDEDTWATADPDGVSFIGINTPEDLQRAEVILDSVEPF
jgi:hypothetical protein